MKIKIECKSKDLQAEITKAYEKANEKESMMDCSICGSLIGKDLNGWEGGHNAWPINEGRCCESCNAMEVLPVRLRSLIMHPLLSNTSKENLSNNEKDTIPICRCCGKPLYRREELLDRHPIHTMCMVKHWTRHNRGINASRCKEFSMESRDS
jgi:hypothetical protein